jgi:hypothetical protein
LSWLPPVDDGGSAIQDYRLVYDNITNINTKLNITKNQYLVNDLTPGSAYTFYV